MGPASAPGPRSVVGQSGASGKRDAEQGPAVRMVRRDNPAAMPDDDRLADGQADPHPFLLGGEEAVEDTLEVLREDARPRIVDGERDGIVSRRFGYHLDPALDGRA